MAGNKLIFIGLGQLAKLVADRIIHNDVDIVGVSRSPPRVSFPLTHIRGDVKDESVLCRLKKYSGGGIAVITLTPDGRQPEDYQRAYLDASRALLEIWQGESTPKQVIYVSSTRVYGQNMGEWIDEYSETYPTSRQGEILLATEMLWRNSNLNISVVRFSGIYSDTRDYLLRQIFANKLGTNQFTNRIHEEDCVRFLVFLIGLAMRSEKLELIYLASDDTPEISVNVYMYVASLLNISCDENYIQKPIAEIQGKRCNNTRLKNTGFRLRYPSYKDGYASIVQNRLDNT